MLKDELKKSIKKKIRKKNSIQPELTCQIHDPSHETRIIQ